MKIDGLDPQVMHGMPPNAQAGQAAESHKPPLQATMKSKSEGAMPQEQKLVDEGEAMLEVLEDAVDKMNDTVDAHNISLQFKLHEGSDRWMVEVWETNMEDELVKEIPPEDFLNMVASIQEMIGFMVDAHR